MSNDVESVLSRVEAWLGRMTDQAVATHWGLTTTQVRRYRKKKKIPSYHTCRSKLNRKIADHIRRLYDTGAFSYEQLAERFGVRKCAIGRVINNQTYKTTE